MNQSTENTPELQESGELLAQAGQVTVEIITESIEGLSQPELLGLAADDLEATGPGEPFFQDAGLAIQITDLPADLPGINLDHTELEFVIPDEAAPLVQTAPKSHPHRETTAAGFERSAGRRAA